jgi:dTDP-4-amino-4,6-dideoxygalactose transaminase
MVPFIDLKEQHQGIRAELEASVLRVLTSGRYALGPEVEEFEREFAAFCGAKHAVAVNSGTSSLHLALLAAGVGPGDEVITVPFTFVATVASIMYTGAAPVLVDIGPDTYTMDPSHLQAAITPRTKALIPVHLYGHPADMDPILEIARRHGLAVIEDAAQAHGAEYHGRRTGSMGDLACFSFYPTKNLGSCGEGGMVVTNDAELARTVAIMRDWGQKEKNVHELPGFNYRMTAFQGAVLRVKLKHVEAWTEARRRLARRYNDLLPSDRVQLPVQRPDCRHVHHLYVVRTPERDALKESLAKARVHTAVHYPIPVHLQPYYARLGYGRGSFPVSEKAAEQVLSLPLYPELAEGSVSDVAEAVRGFFAREGAR